MNSDLKLEIFRGKTMAEALERVKVAFGSDAVILHTRTLHERRFLGLVRRPIIEITAGDATVLGRRSPRQAANAKTAPGRGIAPLTSGKTQSAYGPGSRAITTTTLAVNGNNTPAIQQPVQIKPAGEEFLNSPVGNKVMIQSFNKEVESIRQMVQQLVNDTRKSHAPSVPTELFEHYLQLIQNEVAEELAQQLISELQRELRPEHLTQEKYVREKLAEQIERLIPSSGPIVRRRTDRPHVLALIGPTGVGKTTTLAKLAATLKLKEHYRVGLITLDTYRIAAVEQLKRYADIIGSPLSVVSNPDELVAALASMSHLDFVLIDTAGRSPRDEMRLQELRELLATIEPDEVHLVLSSTAGQSCLELACQKFGEVRVDKIIFTKLDEAAHVGMVLNIAKKINKSLSYVTMGQTVPDDIEVGRGRTVARMILRDIDPSEKKKW